MKFSATDLPLSDTDKTDKTPCSAPGMQGGILTPGFLSEGFWMSGWNQRRRRRSIRVPSVSSESVAGSGMVAIQTRSLC